MLGNSYVVRSFFGHENVTTNSISLLRIYPNFRKYVGPLIARELPEYDLSLCLHFRCVGTPPAAGPVRRLPPRHIALIHRRRCQRQRRKQTQLHHHSQLLTGMLTKRTQFLPKK